MAEQEACAKVEAWESASAARKPMLFDELMTGDDAPAVLAAFARRYPDPTSQCRVLSLLEGAQTLRPIASSAPVRAIASCYYSAQGGGIETAMCALADRFARGGRRSLLITRDATGPVLASAGVEGLSLESFAGDRGNSTVPVAGSSDEAADHVVRLARALRVAAPDVLVHHACFDRGLLWDVLLCRVLGIRVVLNTHNVFSHFLDVTNGRLYAWNDGRLFVSMARVAGLCDAVVSQTEVTRFFFGHFNPRAYEVRNELPSTFAQMAREGLAAEEASAGEAGRRADTILWLGRFDIFKHPEDAVRVLARVREQRPEVRLVYVGESGYLTYEQEIMDLARELGQENHVVLEGFQADVRPYYEQATVLLQTSEIEGFCMVLAEACASGLPVVSYELPYLPFASCGCIEWVRQGDINEAARAVVGLLDDPARRAAMAHAGRIFCADGMRSADTWDDVLAGLETEASTGLVGFVPDKRYDLLWDTLFMHYLRGAERTHVELQSAQKCVDAERAEADQLRAERDAARAACDACRDEYERSASYRVGRALLAPLRTIRRAVRR